MTKATFQGLNRWWTEGTKWGSWNVEVTVRENAGVLIVTRLMVEPASMASIPEAGLTPADLRGIPLARLRDRARRFFEGATSRFWGEGAVARIEMRRRGKRERYDQEFYAEIAEAYLSALEVAPKRPIAFLVERWRTERRQTSLKPQTMKDWVYLARVHGYLTTSQRGVAGGRATRKLKLWRAAKSTQADF